LRCEAQDSGKLENVLIWGYRCNFVTDFAVATDKRGNEITVRKGWRKCRRGKGKYKGILKEFSSCNEMYRMLQDVGVHKRDWHGWIQVELRVGTIVLRHVVGAHSSNGDVSSLSFLHTVFGSKIRKPARRQELPFLQLMDWRDGQLLSTG